jgi:hypothetical protein
MGATKDIPQVLYSNLIVEQKLDPDWVYNNLKCVEFKDKPAKLKRYRVFNQNGLPGGFKVDKYESFDAKPELVLFEGWISDDGERMELKKKG